jgi:hypothetical protein
VPDPLPLDLAAKRRLLYGKGLERKRQAAAEALVEAGRLAEALEVLEHTRDGAALDRVRRAAIAAGDAFSLARACQILKAAPDPAEWRDLAAAAERRERWFDAVNALERAGDAERAEAVRAERCPSFRPFRPAGK